MVTGDIFNGEYQPNFSTANTQSKVACYANGNLLLFADVSAYQAQSLGWLTYIIIFALIIGFSVGIIFKSIVDN